MKFSQGTPNSVLLNEHMCTYTIAKPNDNLTLLERYQKELEGFDDCYLMLSGGSDSQFMLRLLKHFSIKFKAITYKTLWQGGIVNTDDIVYAQQVAEKFNVDLKIVDFDLKEFYESNKHLKWARENKILSPQIAMQLEFISNEFFEGDKLVMGGDMPYLMYGDNFAYRGNFTGLDYLFIDQPSTILHTIKPYYDLCENKKIKFLKNIPYSSPQAVYQILEQQIKIVEDQNIHIEYKTSEPQFRELLQFKKTVWNTILPGDIDTLIKVGGFERLKKFLAIKSGIYNDYDKKFREPMKVVAGYVEDIRYRFKHKFDNATLDIPKRFEHAIKNSNSKCVNGYHFDF